MQQFKVQGMTCGHCARAITSAITAADPQAQITVELASGQVEVASTLTAHQVIELIEGEGYQVQRA